MCQDCPTRRDRVRGVVHELAADLVLPFLLYGIVTAVVLIGGARVS